MVLQLRKRDGQPHLSVDALSAAFQDQWLVPLNLASVGESGTLTFLQKWPEKVCCCMEGGTWFAVLAEEPVSHDPYQAETKQTVADASADCQIQAAPVASSSGGVLVLMRAPRVLHTVNSVWHLNHVTHIVFCFCSGIS
jgi:hypothetical protein